MVTGCIAVKKNLKARGIQGDICCARCGADEESINGDKRLRFCGGNEEGEVDESLRADNVYRLFWQLRNLT